MIRRVRQALGPNGSWLQTVPRRGYRFVRPEQDEVLVPMSWIVGRESESQSLKRWTSQASPLVTLAGPAGIGKTTLAREVLRECPDGWAGHFVDLTAVETDADVVGTLLHALGLHLNETSPEQVAVALAQLPPSFIVLDNVDAFAPLVRRILDVWIARAPSIRWIVTSRIVLGHPLERVIDVAPLDAQSALALLTSRADVSPDDPGVRELVGSMDGLPLAIELVAARLRMLPPSELVERLPERFRLLRRDDASRHRSLRACLDASWGWLTSADQRALTQLASTASPFSLHDARALLDEDEDEIERVQRLVDHCWVHRPAGQDDLVLLPILRAYVREVADANWVLEADRRHGALWARLAAGRDAAVLEPADGPSWRRLHDGLPDLVAAQARASERGDTEVQVATTLGAYEVLLRSGRRQRAEPWLGAALRVAALPERAALHNAMADLRRFGGDPGAAWHHAREAQRAADDLGDAVQLVHAHAHLARLADRDGRHAEAVEHLDAVIASAEGEVLRARAMLLAGTLALGAGRRDEATRAYREALEASRRAGHTRVEIGALHGLAFLLGSSPEAIRTYRDARQLAVEYGAPQLVANLDGNIASILLDQGRAEEGLVLTLQARDTYRRLGVLYSVAAMSANVAKAYGALGRIDDARAEFVQTIELASAIGDRQTESFVNQALGGLDVDAGRWDDARARFARALSLVEGRFARREASVLWERADLALRCGEVDGIVADLDRAERLLRQLDEKRELVPLMCVRARYLRTIGDGASADGLVRQIGESIEQGGWQADDSLWQMLDEARAPSS